MTFSRQPMCIRHPILRLFALFAVFPLLWLVASTAASAQSDAEELRDSSVAAIPELSLLVRSADGPLDDETRHEITEQLQGVAGITRATSAPVTSGAGSESTDDSVLTVFYAALDNSAGAVRPVDVVINDATDLLGAELPSAEVMVGGPAAADQEIADAFTATSRVLLVVGLIVGLGLGTVFGWQRGLVAGGTLALSVLTAGVLGQRAAGEFDGSMAATVVPGSLAGLVVGTAVLVRLLLWFRDPRGSDGAEMIRQAVLDLLPELVLILSGLFVSAVVVGLMDPGPTPLTAMTMGAFSAAAIQIGVTAPALALLLSARENKSDLLPFSIPDGRDLPLLALSAVAMLLVVLALFGFGRPAPSLLDSEDLSSDSEIVDVAKLLRTGGGDATSAVAATASGAASQVDLAEWGRVAAELPTVEWVQVGQTKFTSVEAVEVPAVDSLLDPSVDGVAMVVLADPPRSEQGSAGLTELADLPLVGGPPTLSGPAIDSIGASGDRSTLLVAVMIMAVTGAIAVRVLAQSVGQAVVSLLLRLLGGMAVLGLFGLIGSDVSAASMVTGLGAVGLGVGLFELEFLSQFHQRSDNPDDDRSNPGQAGTISLIALGLGGLTIGMQSLFGGGPGTGLLGVVLAIAVLIELTVGALLLRPALLGQRAAFHTAVRPVRVALHSGIERQQEYGGVEDPSWRRVIGDLLQAEFRFQSQPGTAVLSGVFVPDTPLYRQAAAHHASLAGAGLRIVGRSPKLRSIKTVSGRSPITLAVTVDHPVRHLVDGEGTVVGVRKAERRSGVLWLSESDDRSYRIAESVELGSVAIPDVSPEDEQDVEADGVDSGEVEAADESLELDESDDGTGPDNEQHSVEVSHHDDNHAEDEFGDLFIDGAEPAMHESGDQGHSEEERTGS